MRAAIIGAGLQGRRRASVIPTVEGCQLVVVVDADPRAAQELAAESGCDAGTRWEDAVTRSDIDAVIVCTPPDLHSAISIAAMHAGKHVLCEKPLARTVEEAEVMAEVATEQGIILKCGFNLRHNAAISQIRRWVDQGEIGDLFYARARYGIGGRPGYDREWRARHEVSGGGELMDQGIHLLDLCRWFLGDFTHVVACLGTYFWDVAPLEDNAFAILRTEEGKIASIHASWTQWKPLFSLEIGGRDGYVAVEGLGGAYGTASATLGRRAASGPFTEQRLEFRGNDVSWQEEWHEFVAAAREHRTPLGSSEDGVIALRLVHALYKSAPMRIGYDGIPN